jgi:hypothetical protein
MGSTESRPNGGASGDPPLLTSTNHQTLQWRTGPAPKLLLRIPQDQKQRPAQGRANADEAAGRVVGSKTWCECLESPSHDGYRSLTMIEVRPHEDSPELGKELRWLSALVNELGDQILSSRYQEFASVGEYFLALEVLVMLGRLHPRIADEIKARFPQAQDVVDPAVVSEYRALAGR